jgi:competence protein ComK
LETPRGICGIILEKYVKGGENMKGKSRILEEYEVNPHTLMLKPIEYGAKTFTEIIEMEDIILSPFKPMDILKKSCEFFGSSYQGRKDGTKELTGISYKAPIMLNPQMSMFLFPTTSPVKSECMWISHSHVTSYAAAENGQTSVTFQNRESHLIPISYSSFENQMLRTSNLRIAYSQRVSEMESKYTMKSFYLKNKTNA